MWGEGERNEGVGLDKRGEREWKVSVCERNLIDKQRERERESEWIKRKRKRRVL